MRIFALPTKIKALIFDMDLTLYSNPEYAQYQIDSLIEKLGELRSLSFEEMNGKVKEARETWALSHDGQTLSLSKILCGFGIAMEEIVRLRQELCEPDKFLKKDKRLMETLEKLSHSFVMGVVTNNPVLVAHKTLAALGVAEYLPLIVGLDTCMISKPHEMPFIKFCELSRCPPNTCVSIGDRYDIDLDIPLKMGMGGILVDGVEDVYMLNLK